jgi:serine/threonine protein kinase
MAVPLAELTIDINDYEFDKHLAEGSFESAYSGVKKATGEKVAIKMLRKSPEAEEEQRFTRELQILADNRHPATLRLLGYSRTPAPDRDEKGPILILPLLLNGDLERAIDAERSATSLPQWTPTVKSKCVFGIAAGMAYLHSRRVLHRDLKQGNVLLDANFEPVIGGFDLARVVAEGDLTRTMMVGSPLYMAPEVVGEEPEDGIAAYDFPVDVYSYGILLYMMFCAGRTPRLEGGQPARSAQQLLTKVATGTRYQKPDGVIPFYWELIQSCWAQDWRKRPSFAQIIAQFRQSHEYAFPGTDLEALLAYEERVAPLPSK